MTRPCTTCGKPAHERKHIGDVGRNWVELDAWTWLCDGCAARIWSETERRIAEQKE